MTTSTASARQFAPYIPPPDDRLNPPSPGTSYQSGGIPTWNTSIGGTYDAASEPASTNPWQTTHGARVDILAVIAYILGPVSAVLILMLEVMNDFVRFHAYQSALLTTPLALIRILAAIAQFPKALRTILTLLLLCSQLGMAGRAYYDVRWNSLHRYHLPFLGNIAARWLDEE